MARDSTLNSTGSVIISRQITEEDYYPSHLASIPQICAAYLIRRVMTFIVAFVLFIWEDHMTLNNTGL